MSLRLASRAYTVASSSLVRAPIVAVSSSLAPRWLVPAPGQSYLHTSSRLLDAEPSPGANADADAGPSALELNVRSALKAAMKARDKTGSATLKAVLAEMTTAQKSSPHPSAPLPAPLVVRTLRRSIAERTDAAQSYAPDSPARASLETEIALLGSFLPAPPSTERLVEVVAGVVEGLTPDERGRKGVQGEVMRRVGEVLGEEGGAVDRKEMGRLVGEAVKRLGKA